MLKSMKKTITLAFILGLIVVIAGCGALKKKGPVIEDFEKVETKPCGDLAEIGKKLVRDYYEMGEIDSARAALQYWTDQCGTNDVTYRTTILLDIAAGKFSEKQYDKNIIHNITRRRESDSYSWRRYSYYPYTYEDQSFETFTARLARDVMAMTKDGSVERLLSECYAGDCDSIFIKLKSPIYDGTVLKSRYKAEIEEIKSENSEGHFGLYAGYWFPDGNNEILGKHPVLGGLLGAKEGKFSADLVGEIRLLDAPEEFIVTRSERVDTTRAYLGYYAGLELGREIFRNRSFELGARIGAGFDGFGYGPTEKGVSRQKIHSFNVNIGLVQRFYIDRYSLQYIGVEGMYSLLDYDRNGGEQLSGNAFTIRVIWGLAGNAVVQSRLKAMDN